MGKASTFHCSVITPERQVLECEATFVAFPAHDGEMGILRGRAPLACKLGIGILRIEADEQTYRYFIDGGFAQMVANRLTLLTPQAKLPSAIDAAAAGKALVEARLMSIRDDASADARDKAIRRAQVQLKLAS